MSAAIAMNCAPSTRHHMELADKANMSECAISEVLAKAMTVVAGQKRSQVQEVDQRSKFNDECYE